MDDPRHAQLSAATTRSSGNWWYYFYFRPPALPAGARAVVRT